MIPIEYHENIRLHSKELDGYRNRILELIVQTYGKLRCKGSMNRLTTVKILLPSRKL